MSLIPKGPHQGHVLVWDYVDYAGTGQGQERVIRFSIVDPETKQFWNFMHCLAADLGDLFCAGHAWNANGDLLVVGGTTTHGPHNPPPLNWGGSRLMYVWEPPTAPGTGGTWHFDPSKLLDTERWYPATPPSTVRLAVPTLGSYLLPRGFYMLFLVTNQGAPSEAAFVRIQ